MFSEISPELIATGVTFLVGMVEAARRFQSTGKIPLKELPWAAKRELFRYLRRSYFTVDKPNSPSFTVGLGVEELETTLAKQGFVPEWPLSYRYGGEVANLRFYFYDQTKTLPHRQIHVRAFDHPDGLEVMCHEEAAPDLHPREHLAEVGMEFEPANQWVQRRLENEVPVGYPSD